MVPEKARFDIGYMVTQFICELYAKKDLFLYCFLLIITDEIWDKHFDYAHIQLRCYSPADHQTALDRYATKYESNSAIHVFK